jgi:RNA polymerase sigma factor (TIGR02999 family)
MSSAELLPIVYDELRQLAAARLAREGKQKEAMQPTSLVHAVYLRLVGEAAEQEKPWDGRGHFFAAAALAMRRILVERARQRDQLKRGGSWRRVKGLDGADMPDLPDLNADEDPIDMLALDGAMSALEAESPELYQVVMLRYFAGLSIENTAQMLDISPNTVKRRWTVARLWLLDRIDASASDPPPAGASQG